MNLDHTDADPLEAIKIAALECAANAILITDIDGNVMWINPAFTRLTGYTASEIVGCSTRVLKSGLQPPDFYKDLWDTIASGKVWRGELTNRRKDGSLYWEEMTITPVEDDLGNITHYIAIKLNVSERKIAEESATLLGRIMDESLNEVYLFDTQTWRFIQANTGALNNTGYSLNRLRMLTPLDLEHDLSAKKFRELLAPLSTGENGNIQFESIYRRKDGSLYPVDIHVQRSTSFGADVYLAIVLDISERIRLEKEPSKSEEHAPRTQDLKSIGVLVGGIAHDFNDIISGIARCADLAVAHAEDSEVLHSHLAQIGEGCEGAAHLARQILDFSKPETDPVHRLQMEPLVLEVLELIRASIPATVKIQQDFDPECSDILGGPAQIHQVIMNICLNAYQAMPDNFGTIFVGARDVVHEPDSDNGSTGAAAGRYVELTVCDDGCGIDEAIIDKIFEPFFTTKSGEVGTGLGLYATHRIVTELGGSIDVESTLGEGTTFTVLFPAVGRQ